MSKTVAVQVSSVNFVYYIDTGVLLENTTLVKFIRNYIRDLSGVFSISSLVKISMMSFPAFSRVLVQSQKWRGVDSSSSLRMT